MLNIEYPAACAPEAEYVLGVILQDFLGIPYIAHGTGAANICLRYNGRTITVHAPFFSALSAGGHDAPVLPAQPLEIWESNRFKGDTRLINKSVPVIFGKPGIKVNDNTIELEIDIFGSAFFMLTRYEEAVLPVKGDYDWYPAQASLACREGFLDRPVVDEYVEILWACMKMLWPGLKRKKREFKVLVSADVDSPYSSGTKNIFKQVRQIGADIIRRRNPLRATYNIVNYFLSKTGDYSYDPYYPVFDWMMDVNEAAGNRVAFYFIAGQSGEYDGCYDLEEPAIRDLLRRIHERGHEIGLHPSYHTCKNAVKMKQEADHLRKIMNEEGISQNDIGGRQHYLRWETPTTARACEAAGLSYDTSLCFADQAGFRAGTCHEYQFFDVIKRQKLNLRERPLIVMECSLFEEELMGMGRSEAALEHANKLKQECRKFNGAFTLLWHNSNFTRKIEKEFYKTLIRGGSQMT